MRDTTKALIEHYVDRLDLSGEVLQIGGCRLASSAIDLFPPPRFTYRDLDSAATDSPAAIIADITDCRDTIPDESFDIVMSSDVFEHLGRPWLAAAEIARILKPGGLAITHTLFAGRNHAGPIDYWHYSAEGLAFLFADLECLEKGYDVSGEHWSVYNVSRKGSGARVDRFQDSRHPLAGYLRQDIRDVPPSPTLSQTGTPPPDPLETLRPALAEINDRLIGLEKLVEDRIGQLDAIDTRSRRLERRIDRAVASFPFRTVLRIRRALHRLLK
jgi:SAM-dependent methyltransferase